MTVPLFTSLRESNRAAARTHLSEIAFELFLRDGFDAVTITDLAAAAGVSRSTVLRYFGTKEDVVLGTIDARGALVAEALRERPLTEDDWTALRRAFDAGLHPYRNDPDRSLALTRLIQSTDGLRARSMDMQNSWQPKLAAALADRAGLPEPSLSHEVRAGAALACVNTAVLRWNASDGEIDLLEVVDEAFATLVS